MILLIETSGKYCSTGLLNPVDETLNCNSGEVSYGNSEQLISLTQKLLDEHRLTLLQLDAVAISAGPGSYTGLRIGTSFAKGICFAAGIPLIAVNTLDTLISLGKRNFTGYDYYIAGLHAIKTEIYCTVLHKTQTIVANTPLQLDTNSFDYLNNESCCVTGNANDKIKEIVPISAGFDFVDAEPHADYMKEKVLEKFRNKEFDSVAHFEPNYIKQFAAGISKKFSL